MELIKTDDGYIPTHRIVRLVDRNNGTMLVEWFNGVAVEQSIAKINHNTLLSLVTLKEEDDE